MKELSDKYILEIYENIMDSSLLDPETSFEIERLCKEYLGEEKFLEFYEKLEDLENARYNEIEEHYFLHGFKTGVRTILASLDKLEMEHLD